MPDPPEVLLTESKARFTAISNILDGIQDYAQGGSLDPDINLSVARQIFSGPARTPKDSVS